MKIVITEKQLEKIKVEMGEALGVPEGILEAGEEIYDKIIQELENFDGDIEELNNDGFEFEHKFKIGDHYFYRVKVNFDIEEHPHTKKVDMVSMSSENESELTDTFVLKSVRDPDEVIIGMKFLVDEDSGIDEIVEYLKKYRNEDIPSLTHELKHAFRDVKEKIGSLPQRIQYVSTQESRDPFGMIPEMNEFLFNSYFIHAIENVVRPTEFAAEMRINNVSKKQFLDFFLNSEIIKRLKKIQNFSYDELKEQLKEPLNQLMIKSFLRHIQIDIDNMSEDEIVGEFLKVFLVNITNKKNEMMNMFLTNSLFDKMFGLQGDKAEFFQKYLKTTTKYGYDYDEYFENEEKYFHTISTMMIKKLAKLYASLKD
jgi:hypothetical protein